jgi:hypothetical protein
MEGHLVALRFPTDALNFDGARSAATDLARWGTGI